MRIAEHAPLLALLVVGSFVAFALVDGPDHATREGKVLGLMRLSDVGPGEVHITRFSIDAPYARLNVTYDISEAAKVRFALLDPDGTRHEAAVIPPDTLQLELHAPATGTWTLEVRTLDDEHGRGYIVTGDSIVLGFRDAASGHP